MLRFAPEGITRPRWLLDFAKTGKLPDLTAPNLAEPRQPAPTFFGAYGEWMQTPLPTWDDIAWLRDQWGGPFMLKGVMRVDDARRAVDAGVTAISVSNHGGNNLDGTPAPIRALRAIAEAVGGQVEIVLDGGIRRGSDVVKALALGARAVMIGRAYLWGLAAGGQAGVENVLDIMRGGYRLRAAGSGPFLRARSESGGPGDPGRLSAPAGDLAPARSRAYDSMTSTGGQANSWCAARAPGSTGYRCPATWAGRSPATSCGGGRPATPRRWVSARRLGRCSALFLGIGTGGVFAWVARRAPAKSVGSVTGIVAAAGGLGGYFPPLVMGATYNAAENNYTIGLLLLVATALVAFAYTALRLHAHEPAGKEAPT